MNKETQQFENYSLIIGKRKKPVFNLFVREAKYIITCTAIPVYSLWSKTIFSDGAICTTQIVLFTSNKHFPAIRRPVKERELESSM